MKQRKKQPAAFQLRPLILIVIGVILMAGAVVWMVLNPGQSQANAPQANAPQANAPRPTFTNDPNGPFPNIPRAMLKDAKKAFDEKSAIFVDVRAPDSYSAGHIPGAINIPLAELESRAGELKPADWIITYCT